MKYVLILTFSILALSVFGQRPKRVIKKLGNDPVFFLDSVNVDKSEMIKYQPEQIAQVSVYKDSNAIKLIGPKGKDGVVYIETKVFAKRKYWSYFKTKSVEYADIVLTPESDSSIQYILNGRILKTNFEGDLSLIDDSIFENLKIIDKKILQKEFGITDKQYGVIIKSNKPKDLYRVNKKF
ncbi:MAG TPA: hypothetical protein VFN30_04510 [Chitinophagaceae bacterium]|nr:hypothetical protein [Chitinophagaceae bacterium]